MPYYEYKIYHKLDFQCRKNDTAEVSAAIGGDDV